MARTRPLRDKKSGRLAGSVSLDGATLPPTPSPAPAGAANPYAAASRRPRNQTLDQLDRQIERQEGVIAEEEAHLGELAREAVSEVVRARFPDATHITVLDVSSELPGSALRRRVAPLSVEKLLPEGRGGETLWVHPDEADDVVAAEMAPYMVPLLHSYHAVRVPARGAIVQYQVELAPRRR